MRKLEIADPEVMRIAIQQEIVRSDESRYDHRLHGLLLLTGGQSCQQVAELFGEDRRTVQRWVGRFESRGLEGLREGERPGRPAMLDAKQWVKLGRDLRSDPSKFGHSAHLWDGKLLSEHLRVRYVWGEAGGTPVPTPLWPDGISTAQAQTPGRPVRPGQGRVF